MSRKPRVRISVSLSYECLKSSLNKTLRPRSLGVKLAHGSVAGEFESKHALSVPKNTGRRGLYKNNVAIVRSAFVAAARFLGGQVFVSVLIEIEPLPTARGQKIR